VGIITVVDETGELDSVGFDDVKEPVDALVVD